jgi:hypothetical protein
MSLPTFQRSVLAPSSARWVNLVLLIALMMEAVTDIWNVGELVPVDTVLQPKRQPSSCSPPWKPHHTILSSVVAVSFRYSVCNIRPFFHVRLFFHRLIRCYVTYNTWCDCCSVNISFRSALGCFLVMRGLYFHITAEICYSCMWWLLHLQTYCIGLSCPHFCLGANLCNRRCA